MTNEERNIKTLKDAYEAFVKGDIQAALVLFNGAPGGHTFRTNAAVHDSPFFFEYDNNVEGFFMYFSQYKITVLKTVSITSNANEVHFTVDFVGQYIQTNKWLKTQEIHVYTFNSEGKIINFTQYIDTALFSDVVVHGQTPYSNKKLVMDMMRAINSKGDPYSFCAPEAVFTNPGRTVDHATAKAGYTALVASVPDIKYSVLNMIADDDSVFAKFAITGTFNGASFQGVSPNGKAIKVTETFTFTIANSKIIALEFDSSDMMSQMGLAPPSHCSA